MSTNEKNILPTLLNKIDVLSKNVEELRYKIGSEKSEMEHLDNQIQALKTQFDMKRLDISQLNSKLEEKTKILNEAKKAYTKIIENTTKLIEAVDLENEDR